MNAMDILKYGQQTILQTLERFPESQVNVPGACGYWSVRDIIAHLASHELILVDALASVATGSATPYLDKYIQEGLTFNDKEVDLRKGKTIQEVTVELGDAHNQALALAAKISPEVFRQPGAIPWYGKEYCLDDFLVYASYGHKREHSAQIAAFYDTIKEDLGQNNDFQTANTIEVATQMEKAINNRDIDALMALYSHDIVFEDTSPAPDGRRYEGQAAIKAFWEDFYHANPYANFQTEDLFANGDRCLVRWKFNWGKTANDTRYTRGIDLIVLRNGKVAENFSYVKG